jgi:hypothetical protein
MPYALLLRHGRKLVAQVNLSSRSRSGLVRDEIRGAA